MRKLIYYLSALAVATPPPLKIIDPGQSATQIQTTISERLIQIIDFFLLVAGGLAVIAFIVGGLQYVTGSSGYIGSRGADRTNLGRRTMLYAVTGIVLIVFAYAIVHLVANWFGPSK